MTDDDRGADQLREEAQEMEAAAEGARQKAKEWEEITDLVSHIRGRLRELADHGMVSQTRATQFTFLDEMLSYIQYCERWGEHSQHAIHRAKRLEADAEVLRYRAENEERGER